MDWWLPRICVCNYSKTNPLTIILFSIRIEATLAKLEVSYKKLILITYYDSYDPFWAGGLKEWLSAAVAHWIT